MTRTKAAGLACLLLCALLAGCTSSTETTETTTTDPEPREPTMEEMQGVWKHDFAATDQRKKRTTYIVVKRAASGAVGLNVYGVRNGGEQCQPTGWAVSYWDGDVLTYKQSEMEVDLEYDPAAATMSFAFDGGKGHDYDPARLDPKNLCGFEGQGRGI